MISSLLISFAVAMLAFGPTVDEARTLLRAADNMRAVDLDPDLVDARFLLMEYHLMAPRLMGGDVKIAREQAAEIRSRDPVGGHRAYVVLGLEPDDIEETRAEHLAAVLAYSGFAGLDNLPRYRAHHWLGQVYERQNRGDDARAQFEAGLALRPGDSQLQAALTGVTL